MTDPLRTDQRVTCDGCGQEIDPDCCGCGGSKEGHGNVMNEGHPFIPMGCDCYRAEQHVQRFRPYCCHAHGGHDGQVRMNSTGMYVRWQDYERLREALECLLPGLVLDLRYATDDDDKDAMRSRVQTVREALSHRTDWDRVIRGTSAESVCSCYGYQGDNGKCPEHGVAHVI